MDQAAAKALLLRLQSAPLLCVQRLSRHDGAGPRLGSPLYNRRFDAFKYPAVWKRLGDDARRRSPVQQCYSMDFVVHSSDVADAWAAGNTAQSGYSCGSTASLQQVAPAQAPALATSPSKSAPGFRGFRRARASSASSDISDTPGHVGSHYILFQTVREDSVEALTTEVCVGMGGMACV